MRYLLLRHSLIFACFLICPFAAQAEDQTTAFQVSFYHPTQLYPDDYSVDGFRLDLIYGVNKDVQGVDIGMFNEVRRDFKGFQLGLIANITRRSCEGFQAAIFYNDAEEEMHGLQIGIVNHAGSLQGVQIGLLNFNDDNRYLGFLPFINAAF